MGILYQSTSYLALGNYAQNFLYYAVLAIPWNVTINLWNMILCSTILLQINLCPFD